MEAEDQGRRRIAQLIHDDSLQTLLAANQELIEAAPGRAQVQRAHEVVEATIARLREAMMALHPVTLEQGGFEQALGAVARQAARQGGFEIEIEIDPEALDAEDELLLAVARELLTNAARHSRRDRGHGRAAPRRRSRRARGRRRRPRDRPERRRARRSPRATSGSPRSPSGCAAGGRRVRARRARRAGTRALARLPVGAAE